MQTAAKSPLKTVSGSVRWRNVRSALEYIADGDIIHSEILSLPELAPRESARVALNLPAADGREMFVNIIVTRLNATLQCCRT